MAAARRASADGLVVKAPAAGSKISADARSTELVLLSGLLTTPVPPATRTCPFKSAVAEWFMRGAERAGPAVTELLTGSKISVVATGVLPFEAPFEPPTSSTWPLERTALAKDVLGDDIKPTEENEPATGSKDFQRCSRSAGAVSTREQHASVRQKRSGVIRTRLNHSAGNRSPCIRKRIEDFRSIGGCCTG